MTTSEWITAGSLAVAFLGVASAVFTQIWQSRQEGVRLREARTDRRTERAADEKFRVYSDFLSAGAAYDRLCTGLYWTDGDEAAIPRVMADAAGHERLPDLLSQVGLLAPDSVREAAAAYDVALRWAMQVYAVVKASAVDPDSRQQGDRRDEVLAAINEATEAGEVARRAMRADLDLVD